MTSSYDSNKKKSQSSSSSSSVVELSYEQLQDVCDVLKNEQIPLTSKQVLIPFTTRAFIKGQLCPKLINNNINIEHCASTDTINSTTTYTTQTSNIITSSNITSSNELVTVAVQRRILNDPEDIIETISTSSDTDNDTIEMIEMTRHQAIEYLNKEMMECKKNYANDTKKQQHSSRSVSNNTMSTLEKQQKEKSKIQPKQSTADIDKVKKNKLSITETSSKTLNTSNDKRISNDNIINSKNQMEHHVDDDKNNFFEIREELDDNGIVKTGQAINVSDQLKYLQKQQQQQQQAPQPFPTPSDSKIKSEDIDEQIEDITSSLLSTSTTTRISSKQYDTISKRLDRLAQLEEEEMNASKQQQQQREQYDTAVQTTTKKLQGSGWGKGFLNNNKNATKSKKISNTIQVSVKQQEQIQKLNTQPNTTTKQQTVVSNQELEATTTTMSGTTSIATATATSTTEIDKNSKVVSFANGIQVQEVPRIGHRSINDEKQQQQQQQQHLMGNNRRAATLGANSKEDEQQEHIKFPKTFSSDVIAPIVQERKTVKRTIPRKNVTSFVIQQQQEQQQQQSSSSSSSSTYNKVSQFAQRRQQMQQEQIRQMQLQQQQQQR